MKGFAASSTEKEMPYIDKRSGEEPDLLLYYN